MTIRQVRAGEPLAIDPSFLRQSAGSGPQAFFWLFAPPIQETEYRDDGLAIVHVRGPLEHHDDPCSDSYDAIVARTEEAFACEEAKAVVLRIDSPGGVVSGLSSAVDRLRQCAKASGKRFVAYVDEMAASAAYALSCSCDEIILPKSAIVGSPKLSAVLNPGIASSLSSVPPVWPSPRPLIIGTVSPPAATMGARIKEVLSPTPPVECLSTFLPGMSAWLTTSPECSIASVSAAISARFKPRIHAAISHAAI